MIAALAVVAVVHGRLAMTPNPSPTDGRDRGTAPRRSRRRSTSRRRRSAAASIDVGAYAGRNLALWFWAPY